jgi:protein-disulfide isomerase/uncharacterized membrane protein
MSLGINLTAKALPYRVYWSAVAVQALLGLAMSIFLSASHYRTYTDPTYVSLCAITKSINCEIVSQSPYAIMASLPVPLWGVFGYLWLLLLLCRCYQANVASMKVWVIQSITSAFFCLFSFYLAIISTFYIGSFCILCVLSYGINLGLLFGCWIVHRRFRIRFSINALREATLNFASRRWLLYRIVPFFMLFVLSYAVYPHYWEINPTASPAHSIQTGVNEDGDPWIGAETPELEITEYGDYRCFQCRKMHYFLRQLVALHPDKVRLVHRHFPMDHTVNPIVDQPYHVGSGAMALLAIHAATQKKFWEINDLLYALPANSKSVNPAELAERVGLNGRAAVSGAMKPEAIAKLSRDVQAGLRLKISGTPAFYINGQVYSGHIPAEALKF